MSKNKNLIVDFIKASAASLVYGRGASIAGYTKDRPPGNIAVILLEGGMDGLTAVRQLVIQT